MIKLALVVPVLKNFEGFTKLIASVDMPIYPIVIDNYVDNIGVGPAWNMGLLHAAQLQIDYAVVVNDDVVFEPGVIRQMCANLNKGYDLVSPQNITGEQHPDGLNFWCFGVKPAEFLRKFGTFDENFAPAYYEDDDMARRIRLKGGKILTLQDRIYHEVRGSDMGQEWVDAVYEKNQAYYIEKWGGLPGQERFPYPYNERIRTVAYWRKPDAR